MSCCLIAAATPTACKALFPVGVTMLSIFSFRSLKKALIRRPRDDERSLQSMLSKKEPTLRPRAQQQRLIAVVAMQPIIGSQLGS